MFGKDRYAYSRDLFARQFEPDGGGYLYRRGLKDAPKRVSAAERDRFVADYGQAIKWTTRAIVVTTMCAIVAAAFVLPDGGGSAVTWMAVAVLAGAALLGHRYIYDAPARFLDRRAVVGVPLTTQEQRHRVLRMTSYRDLALTIGIAVILGLKGFDDGTPHGWYLLWLVAAISLAALSLYRMWRKWTTERAYTSGNT